MIKIPTALIEHVEKIDFTHSACVRIRLRLLSKELMYVLQKIHAIGSHLLKDYGESQMHKFEFILLRFRVWKYSEHPFERDDILSNICVDIRGMNASQLLYKAHCFRSKGYEFVHMDRQFIQGMNVSKMPK